MLNAVAISVWVEHIPLKFNLKTSPLMICSESYKPTKGKPELLANPNNKSMVETPGDCNRIVETMVLPSSDWSVKGHQN